MGSVELWDVGAEDDACAAECEEVVCDFECEGEICAVEVVDLSDVVIVDEAAGLKRAKPT